MQAPDEAALAGLVARYGLAQGAAARLSALVDRLVTDPHAPTSVRGGARILERHIADSLSGLELGPVRDARTIADIGSGAGLPGLPLAIALPAARVALIESNRRRSAFITETAEACRAGNAQAVAVRAEEWQDGLGRFDVVTARALARLDVVAEYAAPLLRVGGVLVAWRGRRERDEEAAAARAAAHLGLEVRPPRPVVPYAGAQHRHLHVLRKVAPTSRRFPRRAGVARKRPLGGPLPPRARLGDRTI